MFESDVAEMLEFSVDDAACIGCVACARVFPDIFKMAGDKAVAHAKFPAEKVGPVRIVGCCPVDAIALVERTPGAAAKEMESLQPVVNWQAEWEKHKNDPQDPLDRDRRYGRILSVLGVDRGYILRLELPAGMPNNRLIYEYGIPRRAPEYRCELLQLDPRTLRVKGHLTDPKLCLLAGKMNSCPVSFKVDYRFPKPIGAAYRRFYASGIAVYAFEDGAGEARELLRSAIAGESA